MKPKLLITRQIFDEVLARLLPHFEVESNQTDAEWSRAELLARVADKDALFVVTSDRVDADLRKAGTRALATDHFAGERRSAIDD